MAEPGSSSPVQVDAGAAPAIAAALVRVQRMQVRLPDRRAVRGYLAEFPELCGLVVRVAGLANDRFGHDSQLSLEVYRDPECDDEYLALFVRRHDYGNASALMAAIDELRGRYDDELGQVRGWLQVTTDFQSPR